MSVSRILTRCEVGLEAPLVHVEVHLGNGLPSLSIVGLPATAVKESKERVRAALANAGFEFPAGRITVNLAPADLPKEGGRFDLPIAIGILVASGQVDPKSEIAGAEVYGELALGGELKPVGGVLLAALHAARASHDVIVPLDNLSEATLGAAGRSHGAAHLLEVCAALRGEQRLAQLDHAPALASDAVRAETDLRDVRGQWQAKRALEIAAAGAHSILMIGPPGVGKSMLAQRLPALLPPLTQDEALEVATIESVAGIAFDPSHFGRRPFRTPHHTSSAHAIVGGGPRARPGAVSLAHHGVLFLDELPEFDRRVLEGLREPLESGSIVISRAAFHAAYPARFQLVAAMNPCPCGYDGDRSGRCKCTSGAITRYRARISGPLLDRIDLRIEVPDVKADDLAASGAPGESSELVRARVIGARDRQIARAGRLNSRLTVAELPRVCRTDQSGERMLWNGRLRLGLSARGFHRVLRVARTIADLAGSESLTGAHVAEALQLKRTLESESTAAAQPARVLTGR